MARTIKIMVMLLLGALLVPGCQKSVSAPHASVADAEAGRFENPGGMWMPQQMDGHEAILRSLGVNSPGALVDPLQHPLGAIVWMGGCSASFVSAQGLIITNHHCAVSSLQFNSTPENNILERGFRAQTKADEIQAMTGMKVWVCQEIQDVTAKVTEGLAEIADDLERHKAIEDRIKAIVKDCEAVEGMRCRVAKYFEGEKYYLIRQLEIKDVRLVYAPARGIGFFGGDEDNWQWPRHTGDYAFFRAYVGPDGKPAEYAEENRPYQPKHHLAVARQALQANDYVMVAGYPGRTSRLKTADEAAFAVKTAHPQRIHLLTEIHGILSRLAAEDEELKVKVQSTLFGVMNSLQYYEFLQASLQENDFAGEKERLQAELEQWIAADDARKMKWGRTLQEIKTLNRAHNKRYPINALTQNLLRSVKMLDSAHTIVRMAEERPKADAERDPAYQQRNWDRMIQGEQRKQKNYDRRIDLAMWELYLAEILKLGRQDRQEILTLICGKEDPSGKEIKSITASFYSAKMGLENVDHRVALLRSASTAQLQAMDDPMIQLALRLRSLTKRLEETDKRYTGAMALLKPAYMQALRQMRGAFVSPDANSTLRITYGAVQGYRPKPDARVYTPFTKVSGVLAKDTGKAPFNSPKNLLQAARAGRYGAYASETLGETPVNFLSNLDTTGGNSGSATLNKNYELVGLLFDGNSESMASDWLFLPEITRSIHVDIQYVLWIMDYVDEAHDLLKEMGIKPENQ
jgi:hypothetical protein